MPFICAKCHYGPEEHAIGGHPSNQCIYEPKFVSSESEHRIASLEAENRRLRHAAEIGFAYTGAVAMERTGVPRKNAKTDLAVIRAALQGGSSEQAK